MTEHRTAPQGQAAPDCIRGRKVNSRYSRAIAWGDAVDLCADALYLRLTGLEPEQYLPGLRTEPVRA